MVIRLSLFFCFFFSFLFPQEIQVELPPKVSVVINQGVALEDQPIIGTISIIREVRQPVDEKSFRLDNQPIEVSFLGDIHAHGEPLFSESEAASLVVSRYEFHLPPRKKGLYLLDPIAVTVGNIQVESNPITYQVTVPEVSEKELKLRASVKEKGPFYPGQKLTFLYEITFLEPIELVKEDLPVLSFDGFQTIGAPHIETFMQQENTVQQIAQEARAMTSGLFVSGASEINGYVTKEAPTGEKVRVGLLLKAQAPPLKVEVLPFPDKGKPESFTGALGEFLWRVRLLTAGSIVAGEKMKIEISVTGRGDLDTVTLPDLEEQKGIKGNFSLPDILPPGTIVEGTKSFTLDLFPQSEKVKEIPALQFSSFDPLLGRYFVTTTEPIPIVVRKGAKTREEKEQQAQEQQATLEIDGNVSLNENELRVPTLPLVYLVSLFCVLLFLLVLQFFIAHIIEYKKLHPHVETSKEMFLEALKHRTNALVALPLIRKALLLKLYEKKETEVLLDDPELLKKEGIQGDVKRLIASIDELRFSGAASGIGAKSLIEEAARLYYYLG